MLYYYVSSHHCFIHIMLAGVENLFHRCYLLHLSHPILMETFFFLRSKDLTLAPFVFQHFRLSLMPVMISLDLDFISLPSLASTMNLLDVAVLS